MSVFTTLFQRVSHIGPSLWQLFHKAASPSVITYFKLSPYDPCQRRVCRYFWVVCGLLTLCWSIYLKQSLLCKKPQTQPGYLIVSISVFGASQVITSLVSFPIRNLFFHTCSLAEVDQTQQILKMMFNQKSVVLQASWQMALFERILICNSRKRPIVFINKTSDATCTCFNW